MTFDTPPVLDPARHGVTRYPFTYVLIPHTPDRRARLQEAMAAIHQNTDPNITPYAIVTYENDYIGFPNAIRDMVDNIDGYVFMCASDLIMGPKWLEILWRKYEQLGRKGAVEPFNEIQQGGLAQHTLSHSSLVKEFLSRAYFHYYADNEMSERIKEAGLYTYVPEAPMEHRHVINQKAEMDEGYRVVLDPERNEKDRVTYEKRKAAGWPD